MLMVVAPAAAGATALLWRDPDGAMGPSLAPRAYAGVGLIATLVGSAWVMWDTGRTDFLPIDGFDGDPWRGLLVLCIVASTGAWLVRRREAVDVLAGRLALTSALVGSVLADDGSTTAAFVAASAACVWWLCAREHISGSTAGAIIATDLALVAMIWLRAGGGLATPMRIDGWVAWAWGAAVLARAAGWSSHRDEPGLALAYRIHAVWLIGWVVEVDALTALGFAGALGVVLAARRAARNGSAGALGLAFAMLAIVSLSLGEAELVPAIALFVVATGVTGVACALGRPRGVLGGLVPAGAALPGVAVLAAVVLRADDLAGRAIAIGVCIAACYAAAAVGTVLLDARTRARMAWVGIPLAAGALVASWPTLVTDAVAPALGASISTRSLLPLETGIPRWFIPLAIAVIAVGVLFDRAREPHAATDESEDDDGHVIIPAVIDGPFEVTPGWCVARAHAALAAASIIVALAVLARGVARGFL